MPAGGLSKTCAHGGVFFLMALDADCCSGTASIPVREASFGGGGGFFKQLMGRYKSSFGRCWDYLVLSLLRPQTTISLGIPTV